MRQDMVWLITLALMAALAVIFLMVAQGATRAGDDVAAIAARVARVRILGFWTLLATGVVVSGFTLRRLPYHALGGAEGGGTTVRVTGLQWGWIMERDTVAAGVPVDFEVISRDVNHGFGIFDDSLRVLAQVQAMPGYTNHLHYTFDRPGTYHIMCLEYCGQAHHVMRTTITVVGGAR